jgi:transposase InsO family protein
MPWKERTAMDERLEFVRLAGLEGVNRAELCERFGVSRQTGYKWLARFALGEELADRSRRPLSNPLRCSDDLELAVLSVRDEHPAWGARKIGAVLKHQGQTSPATSTIHAILRRHGRIVPSQNGSAAHLRFERPEPNELWQMDFKGNLPLGSGARLYPLTIVDDHSRYAVCIQACGDERGTTVKPRLEQVFRTHGLPQAFFVDNGNPWSDTQRGKWTKFRVWLLKLGIMVITSRPRHPQSRGKNERFHQSMDDEIFNLRPLRSMAEAQKAFDHWRDIYNHKRPHEGIAMARPSDRYRPSPQPFPEKLPEVVYGEGEIVRKCTANTKYISLHEPAMACAARLPGRTARPEAA